MTVAQLLASDVWRKTVPSAIVHELSEGVFAPSHTSELRRGAPVLEIYGTGCFYIVLILLLFTKKYFFSSSKQ